MIYSDQPVSNHHKNVGTLNQNLPQFNQNLPPFSQNLPAHLDLGHTAEKYKFEKFSLYLQRHLTFTQSTIWIYDQLLQLRDHANKYGTNTSATILAITHFRQETVNHFHCLSMHIENMGALPTLDSTADIANELATTLLTQLLNTPSLTLAFEATAIMALKNSIQWDLLIVLAEDLGLDNIAQQFELLLEQTHYQLSQCKQWHEEAVRNDFTSR